MPNQYGRPTDLEKLQLMKEETKKKNAQIASEDLTPEERMQRLYAPAICGSQAWLDRSITWEMKQAMEERKKEEELEERERKREIEKELERERERERETQKRRKK